MTQFVNALSWVPQGVNNTQRVASVTCDGTLDTDWIIANIGTATGNADAANVVPRFVQIDNLLNSATITLQISGVTYTVSPFTRENFPINEGTPRIGLTVPAGFIVPVWISETFLSENRVDSYAAQQAANAALIAAMNATTAAVNNLDTSIQTLISITPPTYTPKIFTAGSTQVAGDRLTNSIWALGGTANYNLLPAATAGADWSQKVSNPGGSAVTIRPNGAETINNVFTNANGLILNPGDEGEIYCDGTNWGFRGTISYTYNGALNGIAGAAGTKTIGPNNHRLGKIPDETSFYIQANAADGGYAQGTILVIDRFDRFSNIGAVGSVASGGGVTNTTTQSTFRFTWAGMVAHNISNVLNVATGQAWTVANWTVFVKLIAYWS